MLSDNRFYAIINLNEFLIKYIADNDLTDYNIYNGDSGYSHRDYLSIVKIYENSSAESPILVYRGDMEINMKDSNNSPSMCINDAPKLIIYGLTKDEFSNCIINEKYINETSIGEKMFNIMFKDYEAK